jgi:hypothetical protein
MRYLLLRQEYSDACDALVEVRTCIFSMAVDLTATIYSLYQLSTKSRLTDGAFGALFYEDNASQLSMV